MPVYLYVPFMHPCTHLGFQNYEIIKKANFFCKKSEESVVSLHSLAANKHSNSYMEDSNKKLFKVVRINEWFSNALL